MKIKGIKCIGNILLFVVSLSTNLVSQKQIEQTDSLNGFNEQEFTFGARKEGVTETQIQTILAAKKRAFIIEKYQLGNVNSMQKKLLSVASPLNEDFEDAVTNLGPQVGGNVNGWSFFKDVGATFCSTPMPTIAATAIYTVYNAPVYDSNIGASISSYFNSSTNTQPSGSCFIRLNDNSVGAKIVRMSKTYIPDNTNALFRYSCFAVLNNQSHTCCDLPGFKIKVTVTNTVTNTSTVIACPQVSISTSAACGSITTVTTFSTGANNFSYSGWIPSSIDLSPYIGNAVTLDIYAIDCSLGAHAGYVYFDAKFTQEGIISFGGYSSLINNPAGVLNCQNLGMNLTAPPNSGPYSWASNWPGLPFQYTLPSLTNDNLVSSVSIWSLTLLYYPNGGLCGAKTQTINYIASPNITPTLATQVNCSNNTASVVLTNFWANTTIINYNWQPAPINLAISSNTLIAVYNPGTNGVVTTTNSYGCVGTKTFNLSSGSFSFTSNGSVLTPTCSMNTVSLIPTINTSYNNLVIQYTSIPNGATLSPIAATSSVGVSTPSLIILSNSIPGNYFYTITNTLTSCQATGSFVVTNCAPVSLNELTSNLLVSLFPNPSNGDVTLIIEDGSVNGEFGFSIFDLQGRLVRTQLVKSKQELKLELQKGLYLYQLVSPKKEIKRGKLIVD